MKICGGLVNLELTSLNSDQQKIRDKVLTTYQRIGSSILSYNNFVDLF
jgi:hypothetical protein